MRILSWIIFFIIIMLQGVITTLPITLIFLLCLAIMKKQEWIFILAFAAGLLLDTLSLRTIGQTSLFLVTFIFLVLLYQRKYEIDTLPFVLFASFFGSLLFLILNGYQFVFLQAVLSSIIAVIAFMLYRVLNKNKGIDGFRRA